MIKLMLRRTSSTRCRAIATLAALLQLTPVSAFSDTPSSEVVVKPPTAPPSYLHIAQPDPFGCHRKIVYQGKTLDCDTNVQRDGENLRPIIKDVPAAVSELDTYQRNRRNLKYTAYAFSAAILIALGGYIATRVSGTNGQFYTTSR